MAVDTSTKRVAITKANAQMVAIVGAAAFISVFCLIAAQAVWSSNRYHAKVIDAKEKAHRQLQANLAAYNQLATAYKKFDRAGTNVIGGSRIGTGDRDGANSKIILDALPSSYDFPALTSSLEKIIKDKGLQVTNITGTDDQVNQEANSSSPTPQPVEMPFSFTVGHVNYQSVQDLIDTLQLSIRPIQIDTINLSGGASNMSITVEAHTYYQPAKNLKITKQVVK
jgi:hypothetical protein